MKRGRPNKRKIIQQSIIEILSNLSYPVSLLTIKKRISDKINQKLSWNTVKKYMDELIQANKVQPITLPHSKKEGKQGLTVYLLKR